MANRIRVCEFCKLTGVNQKKEDGWLVIRFNYHGEKFEAMACESCKELDPNYLWELYSTRMKIEDDERIH